jgi:hypothetical protein
MALLRAAEDAARADAARREAERAERQAKIDASAEAIAEHLAALWSTLSASRDLPQPAVMSRAVRLAAARVGSNSANVSVAIIDAIRSCVGIY